MLIFFPANPGPGWYHQKTTFYSLLFVHILFFSIAIQVIISGSHESYCVVWVLLYSLGECCTIVLADSQLSYVQLVICFDFCRWWFNTQFNSLSLVLHAGLQVCHVRVSSRVRQILVWAIHRIRNPFTASPRTLLPRDPLPWFLSPGNMGTLLTF